MKHETKDFTILKSDDLIIGGYASIEMVDKQNDLITLKALEKAVNDYMGEKKFRNVMSNHSNVQVGEVVDSYRDKNGVVHKSHVDDVGFYVVIKLRDDIEKAKEISRGIRKGTLRSFSIGGQAISKRKRKSDDFGEYNEIDELELHEVTICEKGINPEAKFDILKEEKNKGEKMTEKLEKALEELNDLMKQVNDLQKEEEMPLEEDMEYMATDGDAEEELELSDESSGEDEAEKALDEDSTRDFEAGEEVVSGGTPTATPAPLKVSKEWDSSEFTTLDLTVENVEKAYEQYKAEQLEKIAYDSMNKQFESRFATEQTVRKATTERNEYDARSEVAELKEQFADLRKSLTTENSQIVKEESTVSLPDGFPTTTDDISAMSWGDIHNLARKF
jgi:HK97 family phage prohead protease